MKRYLRLLVSLFAAIVLYYTIHEGAHLLVALILGTFQEIRVVGWGLGIEVVANTASMSDFELFVGSAVGFITTLIAGYILVWKRNSLQKAKSKYIRAIAFYTTMVLLLLDPLYLSVLYRFVGGGDMNGILLIGVPEIVASIFFAILFIANLFIVVKVIYPSYRKRFLQDSKNL